MQWYTESSSAAAVGWLTAAHQALGSASAGGYINYPETGDPLARYLDSNLQRFTTVRQTYDPNRVLRSGIGDG